MTVLYIFCIIFYSPCVIEAATTLICLIFDVRFFYENLSINSKFGQNRPKISGTLHDGLNTFYRCRRHLIALTNLT